MLFSSWNGCLTRQPRLSLEQKEKQPPGPSNCQPALNSLRPREGLEPSILKLPLPQVFLIVPRWDGEGDHHLKSLGWRVWGARGDTREPLGMVTVKAEEAPFHVTS